MPTLVDTTNALLFIHSQLTVKAEIQVTTESLPVMLWEQSGNIRAKPDEKLGAVLKTHCFI